MKQGRAGNAEALLESRADHLTNNDAEFCYTFACVLGFLGKPEAAKWLQNAIVLCKDPKQLKLRALDQPEFEQVWRNATE